MDEKQILKVLIGSRAHGLAGPDSDYDYRGVFMLPTRDILRLDGHKKNVNWYEDKIDDTSYELSHFLHLATKCNPTILEVFLAPIENITKEGEIVRSLFPYVWNSTGVLNAFIGYGVNQRKKFFDGKDIRPAKYATAYLRTLYQAHELLTTGTFTIKVGDTEIGDTLRRWKSKEYTVGEVIQICYDWETKVKKAYEGNKDKQTDMNVINEALLSIRQSNW